KRTVRRTPEHQQKLTLVMRRRFGDPEYRKRLSRALKSKWEERAYRAERIQRYRQAMASKEEMRREKIRNAHRKLWKSNRAEMLQRYSHLNCSSRKEIISEQLKEQWNSGKRGGLFKSNKCKKIFPYRSRSERSAMENLEYDDRVASWEYEAVRIPYQFQGETHAYIVDFVILMTDGRKFAVEIKPHRLILSEQNSAKFSAARLWCDDTGMQFKVLTEQDDFRLSDRDFLEGRLEFNIEKVP
ncbi:MAG: TnsA endonuclease N-terminal domain-containing protein, partial [Methylococcaceae bacterium]|nr:TnsA endonuclease N-terminal domain-containing protein [Methylococcaceae bacterium]